MPGLRPYSFPFPCQRSQNRRRRPAIGLILALSLLHGPVSANWPGRGLGKDGRPLTVSLGPDLSFPIHRPVPIQVLNLNKENSG